MHDFSLIQKIFGGHIEQAFTYPHMKYLSNWTIQNFSINYHEIIAVLECQTTLRYFIMVTALLSLKL